MAYKLKRYAVFKFMEYYPSGGWNDFKGCFDTLEGATTFKNTKQEGDYDYDYNIIIDLETGEEIEIEEKPELTKSEIVRDFAEKSDLPVIDILVPKIDPRDLRGIPTKRSTQFCQDHDKTNSWWATDARGIELRRVCEKCEHLLAETYRADVLTDSNYWADEDIEAD